MTLPLTTTRLTDRVGGVYGPQASWASTGANAFRAASKASLSTSRGETEQELIEYFQYHSDRNSHAATIRLGRYYYTGSIYSVPGGLASGGEGAGEVPQNYAKAKEYFTKVARAMWPMEYDPTGKEAGRRRMSKEMEDNVKQPAMVAAAFLGRMALRGEGGKPDYKRAKLWLDRAAELVSLVTSDHLKVAADQRTNRASGKHSTTSVSSIAMECSFLSTSKRRTSTFKLPRGRIWRRLRSIWQRCTLVSHLLLLTARVCL